MTTNDTLPARSGADRTDGDALWRRMTRRDNLRELVAPRPRHRTVVIYTVVMILFWGLYVASIASFNDWLARLPLSTHVGGILLGLINVIAVLAVALHRTQRKLEAAIALLLENDGANQP